MVNARFDTKGNIVIDATIIGSCKEKEVELICDTGFSADLVLSTSLGCELGMEYSGATNVKLADGSISTIPLFLAKIRFDDKVFDTSVFILPNIRENLVGMTLMDKFEVSFSRAKKRITIKSLEENHVSQLSNVLKNIVPR